MSCVVPGCKSGYGGSNPENLHFFPIPDDPVSELLWKAAIKRKDRYVKSGKVVCQKHFLPEQIRWERKLFGPDGSDLGMSQLHIPYLEHGVVPSQFSWNKKPDLFETQTPNLLSANGISVVEPVTQQPISQQPEIIWIKQENETTSTVNENPSVQMEFDDNVITTEVKEDLDGVIPSQFSWNKEPDLFKMQTPNLLSTIENSVVEPVTQQPISQQQEVLSIKQENESTSTVNGNPSVEMQVDDNVSITEVKEDLDSVVPSQFSWNREPDFLEPQTPNLLAANENSVVVPVTLQPISQQQEALSFKQDNGSTSTVNENPSVEMQIDDNVITTEVKENLDTHIDVTVPFGMTELYTTQFNLPPGWMKDSTFWDRRSLMIYFKNQTFKVENAFRTVTWKAVTIKDDMSVEISILGEPLTLKNFDISNIVSSVAQLQTLLFTIQTLQVCSGCSAFSEPSEIERLYGNTLKRDVTGTWRHVDCSLLLKNITTCQLCQSMRRRVESKIRKLKREEMRNAEKEVLSSKGKQNESKEKSKCRCAIRARDESRKTIKKLESMLRARQLPVIKPKNNVC